MLDVAIFLILPIIDHESPEGSRGIAYSFFSLAVGGDGGPRYLSRYSDSLRAGRRGDRIPLRVRFSAPAQTGPGAHPASCTMVTGSFPEVKRSRRGSDHPPPSSA